MEPMDPFNRRLRAVALVALLAPGTPMPAQELPSDVINEQLPKWVRIGFDHRFRLEGYNSLRYREDNDDRWLLNRFRANLTLIPTSWLSFTFQGQDSRIFFKSNPSGQTPYQNKFDLRQAYTDLGQVGKSNVALRFGRQELAYGDERVIGGSNWGNIARTFDAAKLVLTRGRWQLDLVSAAVVTLQPNGLSHHVQGNNIHFAYAQWTNPVPNSTLQPYFIWRVGRGLGDSLGGITHQDRRVAGARFAGKLPRNWDYNVETLFQVGNVNDQFGYETIRAFAQHAVAGHTFQEIRFKPRVFGEYNYASGDKDPADHQAGTFDQMYPTPHAKYGLADQVGWQNIQHYTGGVDLAPFKKITFRVSGSNWYLAQARDGLYVAGGGLAFRDYTGKSGRHVGGEVDFIAQYNFGKNYVGGGYGHLFPGSFLKAQSPGVGLNYQYLNVGYRF